VQPRFYSHGSAVVSTLQQVAAGAGTALFITMLTVATAAATTANGGETGLAQAAEGMRAAFLCGGIISLFAIGMAFFVRKPANEVAAGAGH
jgi:DHA2 family lincomycin resistance protein-like MFS transporter